MFWRLLDNGQAIRLTVASALLGLATNLVVSGFGSPSETEVSPSYWIFIMAISVAVPGVWANGRLRRHFAANPKDIDRLMKQATDLENFEHYFRDFAAKELGLRPRLEAAVKMDFFYRTVMRRGWWIFPAMLLFLVLFSRLTLPLLHSMEEGVNRLIRWITNWVADTIAAVS